MGSYDLGIHSKNKTKLKEQTTEHTVGVLNRKMWTHLTNNLIWRRTLLHLNVLRQGQLNPVTNSFRSQHLVVVFVRVNELLLPELGISPVHRRVESDVGNVVKSVSKVHYLNKVNPNREDTNTNQRKGPLGIFFFLSLHWLGLEVEKTGGRRLLLREMYDGFFLRPKT